MIARLTFDPSRQLLGAQCSGTLVLANPFGTAGAPQILDLPDTAWINRPAQDTTKETDTTAA
jgi:hypothetical protein